ncbi:MULTISPECIES: GFA family protein [Rhizobium]|uniref:GFA family protein n=1 Tax=Rhizobium TaxID=379 RepID=UPI00188FEAB7|nr:MULTISPECIES: GFA family protein [Rhizobium]QPB23647.1 GFA family protein [Rhizobium sp. 007]ULJ75442.1 GFA family protein [Rhizobium gallicum]
MVEAGSNSRLTGGCRCGAVRYESDRPVHAAICHCEDCRRSSGAPMVGWMGVEAGSFRITKGEPRIWSSNGQAHRHFCAICGTGLVYLNEALIPGIVDVQIATLDDPTMVAPDIQVQVAERLPWSAHIQALPIFDRYPD